MAIRSLNQHIFRLSAGLVVLFAVATLINVWLSTTEQAKAQLASNLQIAQSVFTQALESRQSQLFNSAEVLTADFGFKDAVNSQDSLTIDSVLENQGARISADLMALISLDGITINSTSEVLKVDSQFAYNNLLEQTYFEGGANAILLLDGKLYQTILLVVNSPTPSAYALVGFEIDKFLLDRMKSITQLDASIRVSDKQSKNLSDKYIASTLDHATMLKAVQQTEVDISWFDFTLHSDTRYISKAFLLEETAQIKIWVVLSEDVERLFGEFNQLQIEVTVIALLSVALSLLLGALVAKKLSKPLKKLSRIAQTIASGDYDQQITIDSSTTEIDELSSSFEIMQRKVRERQSQIAYQASHDLLTELNNRYQISHLITEMFNHGKAFQVVGANILGFRGVNDIFGYHNGDLCLQVVAARFKQLGGISARLNGGEFLWIPTKTYTVEQLVEIQHQIELPIIIEDVVMNVKIAMGLLTCPQDCENTEQVLRRLNISLDEARSSPDLLVTYHQDFELRYTRRLAIITQLKKALLAHHDELKLVYQPKLELHTGAITHAEALIRWNNPLLGFVPPDEFIGIAEQAGLIGQVTEYVIKTAVRDAKAIQLAGLNICIAVNLSAKDILDPKVLKTILRHVKNNNLSAACLSFEITESDLVADPVKAVVELDKFRAAGFSIAIDDFGTGYSSLAYLKELPVTELKIDKSFILNLHEQASDQKIVQTILELANNFNLGVIAEGVENQQSLQLLHDWGCRWVQGYHVCRPIPVEDMLDWCKDNLATEWFEQ
ncbi:EAL domain-containing protein [Aliiglaciecola sp. LCG003]|uniref:putative bifunctional diguanylate cyclase/phosphodiesterase n=1 Tax=Aliiglaciecola sp. LCG003 TaxID=3053655 RepID=UPI0025722DD3|nr:EAL domain-containing protein [Aliiglaciecola sp. LCG003]WJG09078.1 EAL domain-containing protein [Aliiglaciecola sp. LCG003]